jgi:hypothetical protein
VFREVEANALQKEDAMRQWGMWLLIFGVGSFVLPMFGLQFKILNVFGESLPLIAGAMAVAGIAMVGMSYRQKA